MIIGIEAQRIFRRNKHGMDYVVLEEIRCIQKMNLPDDEFYVFVAPGEDICLHDSRNVHIVVVKCPTYPLWEQVALPLAIRRYPIQLLHCTSNTAPLYCNVPLVLTLHDIIFLEKRDAGNKSFYQNLGWYYRRIVVPRILGKCKALITVSDYEKQNIVNMLPEVSGKVVKIYNGFNKWFRFCPDSLGVTQKYIKNDGFFFFLANTDPKKNTLRTLKAYQLYLKCSHIKRQLLLADISPSRLEKILVENDLIDIKDHITVSGYILNADLPSIYSSAFAFLYTSLRESFGIPLLEAMACGCPVITSNTSSMPEIASDAALFIDPDSVSSIADAMIKLEKDPELFASLKLRGPKRASNFSWDFTSEELMKLYNKIIC